jgi:hypothetical protein
MIILSSNEAVCCFMRGARLNGTPTFGEQQGCCRCVNCQLRDLEVSEVACVSEAVAKILIMLRTSTNNSTMCNDKK